MGNAEAAIVRNVDKRTSRRDHRAHFEGAVARFRAAPFAPPGPAQGGGALAAGTARSMRVCVRKRPLFEHERQQGEFDMVTCLPQRVVVHDARMHPDMIHMFVNHHDFSFDEAFGEAVGSEEVYERTARELAEAARAGQDSTVMMYGQTGSGKTYTMRSVYDLAARDLFSRPEGVGRVTMSFVELMGDSCYDMLNQGAQCTLTTAADGSVHPYPSVEVEVTDAAELLSLVDLATRLRATAATGVHDQSSRSHAVCRIFVGLGKGGWQDPEGSLTLVDLAGSEHRVDSAEHNVERRKEGAKINASLAALKECVRAVAANAKFVNFRQNRLTQLLRGCFAGAGRHRTCIIACVSPNSKDTEHSLNTLRHACIMDGQGEKRSSEGTHVAGGVVTKEIVGEVNVTKLARDRRAARKAEGAGGELTSRPDEWKKPQPAHQAKQSNTNQRAALDRRCVGALPHPVQQRLLHARAEWGGDRQRLRLQRAAPAAAAEAEADAAAEAAPGRPTQRAGAPSDAGDGGGGNDRALELFRLFCSHGRQAHSWRKNDLRLINTFVVSVLYGPEAQIQWSHPNVALDELERLVAEAPPPPHMLQPATEAADCGQADAAEAAGSRPASSSSGGGSRSASAGPAPGAPPRGALLRRLPASAGHGREGIAGEAAGPERQLRRANTGEPPARRPPLAPPGAASAPGAAGDAPGRAATPPHDAGLAQGAAARAPTAHQDAVRARREALELSRQQSLQRALAKNQVGGGSRAEEQARLEEQLASGGVSGAAAAGLKKRLAALKAEAIREERARAQRQRQAAAAAAAPRPSTPPGQPAAQPPAAAPRPPTGDLRAPEETAPTSGDGRGGSCSDAWPPPARPPPRRPPSGDQAGDLPAWGTALACEGPRPGAHTGAAAAPWGNALSDVVAGRG